MKIVISGYYGFNNTGDEALLDTIINELRRSNENLNITVLSADPIATSTEYNVNSISRTSISHIIREMKRSDVFISGGGGLLQDATGLFSIPYYLGLMLLAKMLGCKTVFLGQGYGPIKSPFNRMLCKIILNTADLITLRDRTSLEAMNKDGIRKPEMIETADITFLMQNNDDSELLEITTDGPPIENMLRVGISIRSYRGQSAGNKEALAKALDIISEKYHAQIFFIPFQLPSDAEESYEISSLMKHKSFVITRQHNPKQLLNIISKMDVYIGMRLHSLAFAAMSYLPSIAINYDPKVESLAAGLGLKCIRPGFSAPELVSCFDEMMRSRAGASAATKEKVSALKEKAKINFEAFNEFANPTKEYAILGVKINNLKTEDAVAMINGFVRSGKPHMIVTPNPEIIVDAQNNKELRNILNSADMGVPDGAGLVQVARKILGIPIVERVTGIDLMIKLIELAARNHYKIFLLGSAPGIAEEAAKNLFGVHVVGTHDGYFDDQSEHAVIEKIKHAKPDILFVGLGSPRQEKWLAKHCRELGVPVSMVIGGSLDVLSGRKKRAPEIFQKLNIEWLYRLSQEPTRWRRQVKLLEFVWLAIKHKMMTK